MSSRRKQALPTRTLPRYLATHRATHQELSGQRAVFEIGERHGTDNSFTNFASEVSRVCLQQPSP